MLLAPPPLASRAAPPLRAREEPPVPVALLPPKKRWLWLSRTQGAAAAAAATTATAHPPAVATQIHATAACAAATDALALPAPATALQADAAASSSPAAGQKSPSSPLPLLAGGQEPHAPPQPPASADGKPPPTPAPAKRVRKVVKKVRKVVKRLVPKGTTSTSASAAAGKETSNTNAAAPAAASAAAAGASPLHLLAAVVVAEEGHEPGEFVPETKLAGDCKQNAAGAGGKSSQGEETTAVELEAKVAGEPLGKKEKPVVSSSKKGGEKDGAAMRSGRQKKRMTAEVFVGGLDRDATEEDVRAALEDAGEIAEVRMIRDAKTPAKNKGYCFVRYSEPAQARKAVAKFGNNVMICGKQCGVEAVEKNDKVNSAQGYPDEVYTQIYYGEKHPFSTLGDNSSYFMSHNSSAPNGCNDYATPTSSYGTSPYAIIEYPPPLYHHGSSMYLPDSYYYGPAEPWDGIPMMRQASSRKPGKPRGSRH